MPSNRYVTADLQRCVRHSTAVPRRAGLVIKVLVETLRYERSLSERVEGSRDQMTEGSEAERSVLQWITILRAHVLDSRCARRRIHCEICELLRYLCSAIIKPEAQTNQTMFNRRLIGWALSAVVWVMAFAGVSNLFGSVNQLNDVGVAVVAGTVAGIAVAAYGTIARFVQETVAAVPDNITPVRLWFDRGDSIRRLRLSKLHTLADTVLNHFDATPTARA
ncbi:MAG: hypothetical protein H0T54_04295 [Geodermatophilaceae bacterium]|nr:hypothetical protein [Geodermatophilaceae bacterium]